jgi:NTP pyrophosphatase (non-canonical NTP hydrolase)
MIALGFGESGEAQNTIKKHLYHGHWLDLNELAKELGDMVWYIATMCNTFDIPLEEIAKLNIAKLKERYPDGFSEYDSINRKGEDD